MRGAASARKTSVNRSFRIPALLRDGRPRRKPTKTKKLETGGSASDEKNRKEKERRKHPKLNSDQGELIAVCLFGRKRKENGVNAVDA